MFLNLGYSFEESKPCNMNTVNFQFLTLLLTSDITLRNKFTGDTAKGSVLMLAITGKAKYFVCSFEPDETCPQRIVMPGVEILEPSLKPVPLIGKDCNLYNQIARDLNDKGYDYTAWQYFGIIPMDSVQFEIKRKDKTLICDAFKSLAA